MLRHRFRKGFQAWLILALALASLLVGRPLHEALHLTAPAGATALLALDETPSDSGSDSTPGETGHQGGTCVWCLLHAEALHPAPALADALRPAPAASTPPDGLRTTVLQAADIRAAPPRGPPLA